MLKYIPEHELRGAGVLLPGSAKGGWGNGDSGTTIGFELHTNQGSRK